MTKTKTESTKDTATPSRILFAIAFLAGAGTMLVEVLAPRVMQPYFGASTFVWTNVIGVILLAMALGYNLGGKLAENSSGTARIAWTLLIAAVLTMVSKLAFPSLAEFLLPSAQALADSTDARFRLEMGSLVASILLFCPPVLLLATLTPQIIGEGVRGGLSVGRASGRVFMWGTLGSLLGTFLPTYWLVPQFGTMISFSVAASFLFIPAVVLLSRRRPSMAENVGIVVVAILVLGGATLRGPIRPPLPGEEILEERESRYQYLRLVKKAAVEDATISEIKLCIDEGLMDFHSVDTEGRIGTLGKYYDYFALLPTLFSPDQKLKVLVLGSGMGTMSTMLCDFWDDRIAQIVDVEIDPGVEDLAAKLRQDSGRTLDSRIKTFAMDGRVFAARTADKFDLILVDAYARQVDIPFHMTTVEFFTMLKGHLKPNGIVALNVSAKDPHAALTESLLRSMHKGGIKTLSTTWVRYWGNRMMWGAPDRTTVAFTNSPVHDELLAPLKHVLRVQDAASINKEAILLTDDFAPVETLTRKTLDRGESK